MSHYRYGIIGFVAGIALISQGALVYRVFVAPPWEKTDTFIRIYDNGISGAVNKYSTPCPLYTYIHKEPYGDDTGQEKKSRCYVRT